jgi:hypothetical protein
VRSRSRQRARQGSALRFGVRVVSREMQKARREGRGSSVWLPRSGAGDRR